MKSICLLAISIFVSIFAAAQVKIPMDSFLNINPVFDLAKLIAPATSKFLYESPLGKVYAMSPDNMPCLVPNFPADNWMPAYNLGPLGNAEMPNPIPRQQFPPAPSVQLPAFPSFTNDHFKLHEPPKAIPNNLMLELIRKK